MSQTIIADRAHPAVPIQMDVSRDGGITGLTIAIKIFRDVTPAEWLDFDDGAFKTGGHVTPTLDLDELDATEAPGMYVVAGGFDLSAITIPAADLSLFVHYDITAGGETGHDVDTIQFEDRLVDILLDEVNTGADHNIKDSVGKQIRQGATGGIDVDTEDVVTAAASTITLQPTESAVDGFLTHRDIIITDGLGAGQSRVITAWDGTTKIATVSRPWDIVPNATSDYLLLLSAESRPVPQDVREAMLLAPIGAPAANSVDDKITDIRGTDNRDLTELAGVGWVGADNLVQAHNKLDLLQADIDNFENVTRVKVSLPTFERPSAGSTTYEFYFNLKDEAGDPVNADGGGGGVVTLEATSHGGIAGDRDSNLGSTVMVNIGVGRYRGTYAVGSAHALEGIHLSFSWAEGGNADVCDKSFTVLDSDAIGYLSSDRVRDDQIATETAAILVDTAEMQPKLPAGNMVDAATNSAEHAATLAAVNALVGAGLSAAQAAQLLYLWTFVGGDPANLMTMIRAVPGTPGRSQSADLLVDQEVTQVDNLTATYEQQ